MTSKPGIKRKDVIKWLEKYEAQEIFFCIKLAQKNTISKTWAGYITKLLLDRIPKKNADTINGKKFVQDFIKKNNIDHIELKEQYFIDFISKEQSNYCLPEVTLQQILNRSMKRFKENQEEDRRKDDYEPNY